MNYDYILESGFSDLCMERKGVYILYQFGWNYPAALYIRIEPIDNFGPTQVK